MSQWKKVVLFIAPPCKISDKFIFKIKETTERGELTLSPPEAENRHVLCEVEVHVTEHTHVL